MGEFFCKIYDFFSCHKRLMWLIIGISSILMAITAWQVGYVEDINSFFPKQKQDISLIFNNLKSKDRIVLLISASDDSVDVDQLIDCAEDLAIEIGNNQIISARARMTLGVNDSIVESMTNFTYEHLPLFLNDSDYAALDSITSDEAIQQKIEAHYGNLISPMGGFIADFIYRDPLNLGGTALKELGRQGSNFNYSVIDNYVFSKDEKTLIAYLDPHTNKIENSFVKALDSCILKTEQQNTGTKIEYFGAPIVANANAQQIKTDSLLTLNIAIIVIVLLITLSFRNKYSVLLILTPAAFGALFALSLIYVIQGQISLIAVGAGSVILGIALSYSIHVLAHTNHSDNVHQLIRDIAHPLNIGSTTTIGAFIGLLFTNSKLLQDFGLFAALTLIGTTIFALVFLPHFISMSSKAKPGRLLSTIDRFSNISMHKNKILVVGIIILTTVCAWFYNDVSFDSNLMNLNYMPQRLIEAEQRLRIFNGHEESQSNIMIIASGVNDDEVALQYGLLCNKLDSLKKTGQVISYSSIETFVIPDSVQKRRLKLWKTFWTQQRIEKVAHSIEQAGTKTGFDANSFDAFNEMATKEYKPIHYQMGSDASTLFSDWIAHGQSISSFIVQAKLHEHDKSEIYDALASLNGVIAADRSFFASKMAEDVNYNFYLILYISGFLIFIVLLLSYGRIELTLMTFLPMFLSWIVILGIMAMLNIEFNIVTIILSTFIFGIGDDFSIFIMDGLLSDYKDKKQVLSHHKTAIFFSAITIIVGMGVLTFAKHPAMKSLGIISLLGILVVVLMSITIQPLIFRLFISKPSDRYQFPYTLSSLAVSIYSFGIFLAGCSIIQLLILPSPLHLTKRGRRLHQSLIHHFTHRTTRFFLKVIPGVRHISINTNGENFVKPAVIIANHQSFVDILTLLSLHPKVVMVTNGWVWNSPFFGKIIRYLDFYNAEQGYETLVDTLQQKANQGYSIIIFPEGTRSEDGRIKRFHKGAFFLAQQLKLDILPILLYGTGLISSKQQPFHIKKGHIVSKILQRIDVENDQYGITYQERTKSISSHFKNEYNSLHEEYNRTSNPHFRQAITKNYIYKGPVLEWYVRIKMRFEGWYDSYDRIVPRKGTIIDLGCGYGALSLMLGMLSDERKITGVDYDQEKIGLANNCFARNNNINFICADIRTFDTPIADAFVISDVLHYIDPESQKTVIQRCIDRLTPSGILIIRDGDTTLAENHRRTEETERWSTQILKFNKIDGPLNFLSGDFIREVADSNNMSMTIKRSNKSNSNSMFILKKQNQ